MKLLLTILLALGLTTAQAQRIDSLAHKRIDDINLHLHKAHKQYRTGTTIMVIGAVVNGLAVLMDPDRPSGFLTGLGGIAILAGGIVQIDSHKYRFRAWRRSRFNSTKDDRSTNV